MLGQIMRDFLIHLDLDEEGSLQAQLRRALVSAIMDEQLGPNDPLPSCRKLAQTLGVARNTVVHAYQALVDDGFLVSRERRGYFVNGDEPGGLIPVGAAARRGKADTVDWRARLKATPSAHPNIVKADWRRYRYPFVYGQVDPALFPIAAWRECSRQALSAAFMTEWVSDNFDNDDALLIEQIRRRVLPRRGVQAAPDEVLVTNGAQNALYIVARLLFDGDSTVGLEDPGYVDARNISLLQTDKLLPLANDDGGLVIDRRLKQCDLIYVTPSHQSPTTVTMSLERRMALLEAAARDDFLIIEDDYDSETNYDDNPIPALKLLDRENRVLYVGSLSKTMAPGLRLGFLVGPAELIAEARVLRRLMLRHPPANNQRTIALFIAEGHHDSFVRKLHKVYRRRWRAMETALQTWLPDIARSNTYGGTSFWIEGPSWLDSEHLAEAARERGVLIEPGAVHFLRAPRPKNFFRLGFGTIDEDRIPAGIEILAELVNQQAPKALAG